MSDDPPVAPPPGAPVPGDVGERSARRWAHLRAALIGLALLGHGVYALPLPDRITADQIARPQAQRDLATWRDLLGSVGIHVDSEELGRFAMDTSSALASVHDALKAPFKPMFRLVGANQSWALFAAATTEPERLVVEIRRAGSPEWVPVLRRLDPCCTWREEQLEYRRVRGVWDGQEGGGNRPGYKGLTKWIAARAFADFPDAERVRVRMEVGRSVYPWEEPDPTVTSAHVRVHRRGEVE